jgi:hypothetical protein
VRKRFKIKVGADLQPLTTHRDCKVLKLEGLKTKPAGRAEGVYESDKKKRWAAGSAGRKAAASLPHSKKRQTSSQLV